MITAVVWYCVFNFTCTSGICIQRDIIGNLFLFDVYKRFLFLSRFFTFLTFFILF